MAEAGFSYNIGEMKCTVFSDGTLVSQELGGDEVYGLNCLFIDSGDHKILIDNGSGEGFQPTAGRLVQNMEAAGISCSDIDRIIFTHGHIDHVSGTCDPQGKPIFPNARYIIPESEWTYLEAGPGANVMQNFFFDYARKYLLPLEDRFDLAADNAEVLPGIIFIPAHGHTPGNSMVEITSGEKRLLCIGDIVHSQLEFVEPGHASLFDVTPEQALDTRARILSDVARSGVLVFACHFQFPGLGYIKQKDDVFIWQTI
jgi:glyoxylase-like metal-dependent hydrolase (beta-lactamase superfamily II)